MVKWKFGYHIEQTADYEKEGMGAYNEQHEGAVARISIYE